MWVANTPVSTAAIETEFGRFLYRDTLVLREVRVEVGRARVALSLAIDPQLCSLSGGALAGRIVRSLRFEGVLSYGCTELERSRLEQLLSSSFCEVVASPLLDHLGAEATHRHFLVACYDEVFQVVARGYELGGGLAVDHTPVG